MARNTAARGVGRGAALRRRIYRSFDAVSADETTIMVLVAVLVGIVGGFGAIFFRWLVQFFQGFAIGRGEDVVALLADLPWWRKALLPLVAGLVVGPLVHFLAREAKGHGVPEVIRAATFNKGVIRPIVAAVKIVASAITIAFGGSVGREGPIVQIGAAMGSTIGQWLRFSPQRLRTLIGCGAAAGIAATFNSPIAGAFFALEIILRDFALVTFSPIIVASVVATAVGRHFLGDTPAFPVPGFTIHSSAELPLYIVQGLLVGLVAVVYVRSLYAAEEGFEKLPVPAWLKPAIGAVPLGLLIIFFPEVYGVGYDSMVHVLDGGMVWHLMLLLVAVKLIAVNITLGSGFSGGIFAPALFLGGMLGGAYGALVGQIFPDYSGVVGAYAMVGMAAMVAAATGGPLTAILILFEMTGEYRIILPLMLACITATLVYRGLLGDSIFTLKFTRAGTPLNRGRESSILQEYHVHDVMEAHAATIPANFPFEKILKLFLTNEDPYYYVVGEPGRELLGRISIHDVKGLLGQKSLGRVLVAADISEPVENVVTPRDDLERSLFLISEEDTTDLPVVESLERPRMVGILTRKAITEVYNREILQKEDPGIKLIHGRSRLKDCVDLPETYRVQSVDVPDEWVGNCLRELDLRRRYNVSVLAVKIGGRTRRRGNELPDPDRALRAGDLLIIVGHVDDLARLLTDIEALGLTLPPQDD